MTTTQRESRAPSSGARTATPGGSNGVPTLPASPPAEEVTDRQALMGQLRRFHLGGDVDVAHPGAEELPALLFPYRRTDLLRTDYPLYLRDDDGVLTCRSLADQLSNWAAMLAGAGRGGRLLDDNLLRLERQVRGQLTGAREPQPARAALSVAADAVQKELRLGGESAASLAAQLAALVDAVPAEALLLADSDGAGLELAIAVARSVVQARRRRFVDELSGLVGELRRQIQIERTKAPEARSPDAVAASLGGANLGIDPTALASAIGDHRGSSRSDDDRLNRCERAAQAIEAWIAGADDAPVVVVVATEPAPAGLADAAAVTWLEDADPCAAADREFCQAADLLAGVLRAVRLARLELDGAYDPNVHDPWLARLTWDGFTAAELGLVTPVLAADSARALTDERLGSLSRLLRGGRPVKVVVEVEPAGDPAAGDLGDEVRFELGYLGISHREALIHQTAAARPVHLVDGLHRALDATRPSIHILAAPRLVGGDAPTVGGWLHTGAALDGRAHPLFCYDPAPGETWARRFDLDGNSDVGADWPAGAVAYRDASGETATMELPFTFADFALLEPGYRNQFAIIPAGVDADDLVGVDTWLGLADDEAARAIPFVWAVDGDHQLRRLAITRALAFACRDRRRFWRTLQEWAGLHNEHVERAVEAAVEAVTADHEVVLQELTQKHADELERVRKETAGEAMQRLANALLDTDIDALASSAVTPRAAAAPAAPPPAAAEPASSPAEAEAAPEPEPAAPAMSFDEPYIDTPLCTTCNDCINLNPVMFVYDENKQAYIADAKAGTFEQLVIAAEKCPAACIHPGKPLNPDEPNLPALQERAAKFN